MSGRGVASTRGGACAWSRIEARDVGVGVGESCCRDRSVIRMGERMISWETYTKILSIFLSYSF